MKEASRGHVRAALQVVKQKIVTFFRLSSQKKVYDFSAKNL